jgi:MazG family protein
MADEFQRAGERFAELVRIMARLRAPGGCPWDRKQTFETIKPYLLEETYEVMDAIDDHDWPGFMEELGDLLLQPVFFAEMAREEGLFSISDSLDAINEKLIRRHPHVFAGGSAKTAEDVKTRWDEIKRTEKPDKERPSSLLDGISRNLPALAEADKIGQKVGKKGFEWPDVGGVVQKLQEEAAELVEAHAGLDRAHIEHEIGDMLFNLVNLARYLGVDPEQALRKTNARFRRRFAHIENQIRSTGSNLEETSLDRMEELWQEAKRAENSTANPQ